MQSYHRNKRLTGLINRVVLVLTVLTGLLALFAIILPDDGFDRRDFVLTYITIVQLSMYLLNRIGSEILYRYGIDNIPEPILEKSWLFATHLVAGVSLSNFVINCYLFYEIQMQNLEALCQLPM